MRIKPIIKKELSVLEIMNNAFSANVFENKKYNDEDKKLQFSKRRFIKFFFFTSLKITITVNKERD